MLDLIKCSIFSEMLYKGFTGTRGYQPEAIDEGCARREAPSRSQTKSSNDRKRGCIEWEGKGATSLIGATRQIL